MKNIVLIIGLIVINSCYTYGQKTNSLFSNITRSYTNEELITNDFGNSDYLVSPYEYELYDFYKEYGVVKAYRIGFDNIKPKYLTIHYYCQMIENGYIQLLANFNSNNQFIDAIIVAQNKAKFINELEDGTYTDCIMK